MSVFPHALQSLSGEAIMTEYLKFQDKTRRLHRNGTGVFFFAYGSNSATFDNFADQAVQAARLLKSHSPGVPLALATNFEREDFLTSFDHIILIEENHTFRGGNYQKRDDGLERQWLTRILYMTASPFQTTIAYDANVVTCGPLDHALSDLASSNFDLAVASVAGKSSLPGDILPHNFAIAYRWNDAVSLLFETWFKQQIKAGVAKDDQHTLLKAAKSVSQQRDSFIFRTLNPSVAAAFASTRSSDGVYPRESRVISGKALVVHGNPKLADAICRTFNEEPLSQRQVVNTGSAEFSVYDRLSCAHAINRTKCRYSFLWEDPGRAYLIPPE